MCRFITAALPAAAVIDRLEYPAAVPAFTRIAESDGSVSRRKAELAWDGDARFRIGSDE